jgi:hypothetical protein
MRSDKICKDHVPTLERILQPTKRQNPHLGNIDCNVFSCTSDKAESFS